MPCLVVADVHVTCLPSGCIWRIVTTTGGSSVRQHCVPALPRYVVSDTECRTTHAARPDLNDVWAEGGEEARRATTTTPRGSARCNNLVASGEAAQQVAPEDTVARTVATPPFTKRVAGVLATACAALTRDDSSLVARSVHAAVSAGAAGPETVAELVQMGRACERVIEIALKARHRPLDDGIELVEAPDAKLARVWRDAGNPARRLTRADVDAFARSTMPVRFIAFAVDLLAQYTPDDPRLDAKIRDFFAPWLSEHVLADALVDWPAVEGLAIARRHHMSDGEDLAADARLTLIAGGVPGRSSFRPVRISYAKWLSGVLKRRMQSIARERRAAEQIGGLDLKPRTLRSWIKTKVITAGEALSAERAAAIRSESQERMRHRPSSEISKATLMRRHGISFEMLKSWEHRGLVTIPRRPDGSRILSAVIVRGLRLLHQKIQKRSGRSSAAAALRGTNHFR